MPSKKEIVAENAELGKQIEKAAGNLRELADELDHVASSRHDEVAALLARRARTIAEHLSDLLREDTIDRNALAYLTRLGQHWLTQATVGALIGRYGLTGLEGAVASCLDLLGSVVEQAGETLDGVPPPPVFPPRVQQDATVTAEPVRARAVVPEPTVVTGAASGDLGRLIGEGRGTVSPGAVVDPSDLTEEQRRKVAEEWFDDPANGEIVEEWNAERRYDPDDRND